MVCDRSDITTFSRSECDIKSSNVGNNFLYDEGIHDKFPTSL